MTTITTECPYCEAPVEREAATGSLSLRLNKLRLVCSDCAERQDRELAAERAETRATNLRHALIHSGLPRSLRRLPAPSPMTPAVRRWASGEIAGVYLFGANGAGKTHRAAWALRERMGRQRTPAGRWASGARSRVAQLHR